MAKVVSIAAILIFVGLQILAVVALIAKTISSRKAERRKSQERRQDASPDRESS